MEKFWNFYDGDRCVLSEPFKDGDTTDGMLQWWYDQMNAREHTPDPLIVHLEDFCGKE